MLPRRALTQKWALGMHSKDIRWDLYPQVAGTPQARGFVVRLQQFSRRPKTIDAYARNLDRYLASFVDAPSARWVEADEGTLLTSLDDLRSGRTRQAASQWRPLPANVVFLSGSRAASITIAQHIVVLRQFYDYLIRAALLDAAGNVTLFWGLEADGNRHFLLVWDPEDYFLRLQVAAAAPLPEAFRQALATSWSVAFELRGKVLNALLVRDWPRACYHGWEFARTSALTIALQERQPYTSSHARRREAAERGHGMADLLAALTTGAHNQLRVALEAVWAATLTWGTPSIQE